MKRFIEGLDRSQTTLLPECIDDYVDEDNPVRAVDAFVDMLDLAALGFDVEPEATGRPGYHPATMLKLYVYGYLNQVQSSRRLERECGRNLELIWLMGRLSAGLQDDCRFPTRQWQLRSARSAGSSSRSAATSIFSTPASSRSTAASSRPSTPRPRATRARSSGAAWARSTPRSTAIWAELDRADEVLTKTGMQPVEARLSRVIKKLAHYRKEAARFAPSSSAWMPPARRRCR